LTTHGTARWRDPTKAGIIGFTPSIAKEVASHSITGNAIAPGFIDTEMTQRLDEAYKQELKKHSSPLLRLSPRCS